MARRLEHFKFSDPLSKLAVARSTRHRHVKKRRVNSQQIPNNSIGHPETEELDVDSFDQPESISCGDESSDAISFNEGSDPEELTELLPEESSAIADHFTESASEDNVAEESESRDLGVVDKVFSSCPLTPSASNLLILKYSTRHNLTQEAVADLLKLLSIHCPTPNTVPPSLYCFQKKFPSLQYAVTLHYFCTSCQQQVNDQEVAVCPNIQCGKYLKDFRALSTFFELPIEAQIASLLERPICDDALGRQYNMRFNSDTSRSDIYDGDVYQGLVCNGFLRDKNNISLTLNTDGIPVFRSSMFSFWPLHLFVNEFPFRMRVATEFRLLGGLWYGNAKPDMSLFLKPLVNSLQKLYSEGVAVSPPNRSAYICKVALIACTCDLPARAQVMNTLQFNAYYGCSFCLQKGVSSATAKGGHVHCFPYDPDDPMGPSRTNKQIIKHAKQAVIRGNPVYGVKGPSWLATVPSYDLVGGMSADYMHCVLLGVTRMLLRLWFDSSHHSELWYIGNATQLVDNRLMKILPPNEIQRTPRSIEKTVKFWKAHELRAWLLHYSAVVLLDILPEEFYQHHLLLVESIYLLLSDSVSENDVLQSAQLLMHYCYFFSILYGERYMLANVHGLLHLPEVVRKLGPLWAHSCFPFESANGELLKLFHGTQSTEKQVLKYVNTLQKLPVLAKAILSDDTKEEEFFTHMSSKKRSNRFSRVVTTCIHALGKPLCRPLTERENDMFVASTFTLPQSPVSVYYKLYFKETGRIVSSATKSRSVLRDNSGVIYRASNVNCYGKLLYALVTEDEDSNGYAIMAPLHLSGEGICKDSITNARINDHLISLLPPRIEDMVLIKLSCLKDKCVLMNHEASGHVYASHLANCKESE